LPLDDSAAAMLTMRVEPNRLGNQIK
jgi:hypothetical protein